MNNVCTIMILAGLITFLNSSSAQTLRCGTDEKMRKFAEENPELYKQYLLQESHDAEMAKNNVHSSKILVDTPVYVIPVVFHVVHNNGNEDISDAQVIDAVRILNEDYRKWNTDTIDIIPVFKSIAGKVHFEFRLAEIDPNGNSTTGIVRRQSIYTDDPNQQYESQVKSDRWAQNKYLNIWSCKDIGGAAGYSYLSSSPALAFGIWRDGIMVLYNHVGSVGTGSPGNSRTITHEAGHWSNLNHPWGPGNDVGTACGDDFVGDTPETKGWQYCSLNGSVCNPPVIENVQNHMDYSYCSNMFTDGQVTRMRNALASTTVNRNNLWKTSNLTATGVDDNKAVFFANKSIICQGTTVQFNDYSYNGMKSWSWSFPGGTPSSSVLKNPNITYNTPGIYDVSLYVSGSAGNASVIKSGYIKVIEPVTLLSEGFENGMNIEVLNQWGGNTWDITNTAKYSGNYSLMLSQADNPVYKDIEEFISPVIDISPFISGITLSFKVAFAQKPTQTTDALRLSVSTNCGNTWAVKWVKSGSVLATVPEQSTAFTPTDTAQWKTWSVSLTASSTPFRYRFEFVSDNGNNIYIDDINITGTYASNVPVLVSPQNNSINLPLSQVKLDWNAVVSIDSYHVQVDTTFAFSSSWLISGFKTYIASSNNGTDTEYELPSLYPSRTYYWRVRTYKSGVPSNWSFVWSFKTIFSATITVNAGTDAEICRGDSIEIGSPLVEGLYYNWSPTDSLSDPNTPNPIAYPANTTIYTIYVSNGSNMDSDKVMIIVQPPLDVYATDINGQDTVKIMPNGSVGLLATGGIQYEWFPVAGLDLFNIENPVATPDTTTDYIVTGTDLYGCKNKDTVRIEVIDDLDVFIPSAFTPDGDGYNDILYVRGVGKGDFEFVIFDRWGELVFTGNDPLVGWNGKMKGTTKDMPQGAYVYYFNAMTNKGEQVTKNGIVNVIK